MMVVSEGVQENRLVTGRRFVWLGYREGLKGPETMRLWWND